MTSSTTSMLKGVGYDADTGNFLLATPTILFAAPIPLTGAPSAVSNGVLVGPAPAGMSGPYGPGSFVFSNSTPQDVSYALGPIDGAGVGADLSQGVGDNPGGDFEDVGGKLTGQDVIDYNNLVNNTSVASDLQNGNLEAAFQILNDETAYLQSQLPSYTPGASLAKGLIGLAGMGVSCSPFVGAAATALGAMADVSSGGGALGPTLKAGAASFFSAATLMPMIACAAAVNTGLQNNNVNYAINVIGTSAINATNHCIQSYMKLGGVGVGGGGLAVKGGVSPDLGSGYNSSAATSNYLGSSASIKLEALGMSSVLDAAKAQGHHMNFLTGVYT